MLWPSPTQGGAGDPSAGGTKYFLSSNSTAEAHDIGDGTSSIARSTRLVVWSITNRSSPARGRRRGPSGFKAENRVFAFGPAGMAFITDLGLEANVTATASSFVWSTILGRAPAAGDGVC